MATSSVFLSLLALGTLATLAQSGRVCNYQPNSEVTVVVDVSGKVKTMSTSPFVMNGEPYGHLKYSINFFLQMLRRTNPGFQASLITYGSTVKVASTDMKSSINAVDYIPNGVVPSAGGDNLDSALAAITSTTGKNKFVIVITPNRYSGSGSRQAAQKEADRLKQAGYTVVTVYIPVYNVEKDTVGEKALEAMASPGFSNKPFGYYSLNELLTQCVSNNIRLHNHRPTMAILDLVNEYLGSFV